MIRVSLPSSLLDLPPPGVSVASPPVTMAGSSLTLTCTVSVIENLVIEPAITWLGLDDSPISSEGNVLVCVQPDVSGTLSNCVLNFTSLSTSQAGQYHCSASLAIPNGPQINGVANSIIRVLCKFLMSLYKSRIV